MNIKEKIMAKSAKPTAAAVSPSADETSAYIVTDTAPMRVAGRRVAAGDRLVLSEAEALSERTAGHIRPEGLPARPAK